MTCGLLPRPTSLAEMLTTLPGPAGEPDGLSADVVADAASAAAGLLVHTLAEIPLGDALPGLHALAGKKIDTQCLTPRERKALSSRGIGDHGEIAGLRPSQLRDWLALSAHSAQPLLAAALREIITGAAAAFPAEVDSDRRRLAFQEPPDRSKVRILLATDAASEGIDLHEHCHRLINYDIPFNPNKLEQRIGRIDRYGQRQVPQVRHFVGQGWEQATDSYEADLEFLSRVAAQVAGLEEDLGSVNAVLAEAVQRRMLGEITD